MKKAQTEGELSSYKAPWSLAAARCSLGTTGRYEPGGNILWCSPLPRDEEERKVAGDPASSAQVEEVVEEHFKVELLQGSRWKRLIFPTTLPVGVRDKANVIGRDSFYIKLPLTGGRVYVAGWYVAMSRALSSGDLLKVAALLECGLTVTYHVRECADLA